MNAFETYTAAPPSEQQWIAREEEAERSLTRRNLAREAKAWELADLGEQELFLQETGCTPAEAAVFIRIQKKPSPGEQKNGTFVVPKIPARASVATPAPTPAAPEEKPQGPDEPNHNTPSNGEQKPPAPPARAPWTQTLLTQTNALVDAYAAAVAHASKEHGNQIKAEDVRNLMTTVFIGLQNRRGNRAA